MTDSRAYQLPNGLTEGGVFAYRVGLLRWGYIKVLKVDDLGVHVRHYSRRSFLRPLSPSRIVETLGSTAAARDYSAGHLPISRESAGQWQVVKLLQESVIEEELEGYRLWAEDGGSGYFA